MAASLLAAVTLYAEEPLRPGLHQKLDEIAGPSAKNCGAVPAAGFAIPVSECAEAAFQRRLPFYVVYYERGVDSVVGGALAGNAKGDVFELRFDLGSSAEAHATEKIEVNACSKDVRLVMSRDGRLRCDNGKFRFDSSVCGAFPLSTPVANVARENGTIRVELVVRPDGTATVLGIPQSDVSKQATDAAIEDVANWRFAPALKDGAAVAVRYPVEMRFNGGREEVGFPEAGRSGCAAVERVIERR